MSYIKYSNLVGRSKRTSTAWKPLDVMVSHHPEPVQVVMDMSAAPTAPVRMRPGRSVDEAAATHDVERIILVAPGHFMPRVDCPVDVVETIDEAKSLLSAQSPSLIPA